MNKSSLHSLQNLPPELQLYADRFLGKLPIDSENADPSFSCTQHPRNGKVKATLGGMKKGFLCSSSTSKADQSLDTSKSASKAPNAASAHPNGYNATVGNPGTCYFIELIEGMEKFVECLRMYGIKKVKAQLMKMLDGKLVNDDDLISACPCPIDFHIGAGKYCSIFEFLKHSNLINEEFLSLFFSQFDEQGAGESYRGFETLLKRMHSTKYVKHIDIMHTQMLMCVLTCMKKGKWKMPTCFDAKYTAFTIQEDSLGLVEKFTAKDMREKMQEMMDFLKINKNPTF